MTALLASPLGLLVGASLGALGGGGSILAVPTLVYVAGQSVPAATTTSLLVVGLAAAVGLRPHWKAGRVRVGTGVAFGLAGVGGSVAGSVVNPRLDPDVLLLAFAGAIAIACWRMVTACPTCTRAGEQAAVAARASPGDRRDRSGLAVGASVVLAGTVVGFFTGLFGVGGGFIAVPALTLLLGFAMPEAIGTSLLVITINSSTALLARVGNSDVEWAVTLPFAAAAIAGVLVGTRLADRIPDRASLRGFAALLALVALYTAARSVVALT